MQMYLFVCLRRRAGDARESARGAREERRGPQGAAPPDRRAREPHHADGARAQAARGRDPAPQADHLGARARERCTLNRRVDRYKQGRRVIRAWGGLSPPNKIEPNNKQRHTLYCTVCKPRQIKLNRAQK